MTWMRPSVAAPVGAVVQRISQRGVHAMARAVPSRTRWAWPVGGTVLALALGAAVAMRPPLALDAPRTVHPPALDVHEDGLVYDKASHMGLPAYITPDSHTVNRSGARLRLVGLGVRTVTFLRMKVYVAALYVDEAALQRLPRAPAGAPLDLEACVAHLLESGVTCAVRVLPVRSTDFAHLRDGLVRSIHARAKEARTGAGREALDADADAALTKSVLAFKAAFPRGSVARGRPLDLVVQRVDRTPHYALSLQVDGREIGTHTSGSAAPTAAAPARPTFTLPVGLLLAYVSERSNISPALRASVYETLAEAC